MTVKTRAAILAEIAALLANNTTGDITPQDLRTVVEDLADSMLNPSSDVVGAGTPSLRVVTAAGAIDVDPSDDIIGVNKSVGAATTVNLGLAEDRLGRPIIIKDLKGDAATNAITPAASGGETIDGLAASAWAIGTNFGSITFYPKEGGWYVL